MLHQIRMKESNRERERDRQTDRQSQREREKERMRETDRQRQRFVNQQKPQSPGYGKQLSQSIVHHITSQLPPS